jgi:preprotein translocase subunit YajC
MMLVSVFIIGVVVAGVIFLTVILPQQQRKLKRDKESFELKTV